MKKMITLFLFVSTFVCCKQNASYKPSNLTKVSEEQLIQDTKNHKFPNLEKITFKNTKGEIIPQESLQTNMQDETLVPDYYQNAEGITMEAVIRKSTAKDKELGKKLQAAFDEGPDVILVEINCEDKNKILNEVYQRDQGMRKDGSNLNPEIDKENLNIIVSFIEKCGLPTLDEVSENEMAAVWLVLQHAPAKYQSKYIPNLEEAAKQGDIQWGTIALMKDRALMHKGEPQIYGSQVSDNKLYNLAEPEYVNQRRKEMGMEPLGDYLKHFGIEFKIDQKTK